MVPRFNQFFRVIAALLAASAITSLAGAADQPAVKKSRAGICHERGSQGYEQTIHFKAFGTIQACLSSGGRLPKNSSHKKPQFDPLTPAHRGDDGVLFGPLVRARSMTAKVRSSCGVDFTSSGSHSSWLFEQSFSRALPANLC